jgi:hypothetical protein
MRLLPVCVAALLAFSLLMCLWQFLHVFPSVNLTHNEDVASDGLFICKFSLQDE